MANLNLNNAKKQKNDEFYTCFQDIKKELEFYKEQFKDKVVLCNCDDPEWSNFWKYFYKNFELLGLKKLISTHYSRGQQSYMLEFTGVEVVKTTLRGDGDFRSEECIEILKKADIVCTNPPFSLFRCFLSQLMHYKKGFLIIGNMNAIKYKTIFPYFMENKVWFGHNTIKQFIQPDGKTKKFGNICWYSNLDTMQRHTPIQLTNIFEPDKYPKYDNYDAIEVGKVTHIPKDYFGIMGVPISFLYKYSPEQFEIIGEFNHGSDGDFDLAKPIVNGRELFPRIAIKRRCSNV